jgi:flotillin
MIISGMMAEEGGRRFKIVVGGGTVMLPMIQQKSLLDLTAHKTTAALSTLYSKDNVPICASAILQFKVIPTSDGIAAAATALLGKTKDEMAEAVENIVERPFIALLQRHTSSELKASYTELSDEIMKSSKADLANIGLELVSCTIKSIDEVYDRRHAHGEPV